MGLVDPGHLVGGRGDKALISRMSLGLAEATKHCTWPSPSVPCSTSPPLKLHPVDR